jgi:hypothetical protein
MAVITVQFPELLVDFANSGFTPKDASTLIKSAAILSLFTELAPKTIGIGIMPAIGGSSGGGSQGQISFN